MTNDITTLNGALRELGETMADNLTTMGVPSTYDEGLTTLAQKILSIGPTPSFDGITLTSDKSILSYADSEYATLSAQLTSSGSPASVSGETVTFEVRKSSDDSLVETLTGSTNSTGLATVSYYGEGVGDLSIHASARTFVSETYSIEDCKYYSTTEYKQNTDGITLNISLPSTFKLEFDIKPTSRSTSGYGSGCYLRIGTTSDSGVWAGQLTSAGKHGLMPKPSGTTQYCTSNTVLSTDNHIVVTFDGSTASYTCNGESVSLSASSLTKINGVVPTANNGLKNIKIKPL